MQLETLGRVTQVSKQFCDKILEEAIKSETIL